MNTAAQRLTPPAVAPANPWWRGATIYQIYPRSFLDTNGDGVGDLPGIIQRLDYVASLGVEAIWVSPFFKSPMADFGYDIADYCAVDPIFGTLEDFDRLIAKAHALSLKVIIDQVPSHTSDQHAWFEESRQSRINPKADWYVWADAREDGTPPNNWLSIFGGVAWTWEPRRGQYYLHNFLSEQPDLNFHNPEVRQATLDNMRFWLDRGVDGLRLDAINFCFHDVKLRDNPARPKNLRKAKGVSADNPYGFQWHRFNNTQPEMLPFLEEIRRMLDEYPDVVALGEISSDDSTATVAEYTQPGRLHMAYSFELLSNDSSPGAHSLDSGNAQAARPAELALLDHLEPRRRTRGQPLGPQHVGAAHGHAVVVPRCLPARFGVRVPGRRARARRSRRAFRSAARSVWHRVLAHVQGTRWLPHAHALGCHPNARDSRARSRGCPSRTSICSCRSRRRRRDKSSALHGFRRLLEWRKTLPLLINGDIEFLAATESVLAFRRFDSHGSHAGRIQSVGRAGERRPARHHGGEAIGGHGLPEGSFASATLHLPGHGVAFFALAAP